MLEQRTVYLENYLKEESEKYRSEGGSFNRRINDIGDRYNIIMSLTEVPEVTEEEEEILIRLLEGSLNVLQVKRLDEAVLYSNYGDDKTKKELAEKVVNWSAAEVIALLEEYEV